MECNKLINFMQDDVKTTSFIKNMSSGYMELPYIMEQTLDMLSDDSPMYNIITNSNKKALCIMLDQYFTSCYDLYIDDIAFDKLLKFGCIEVYKVDAANGLRYATTNEVAQGVKGLIGENIYPAGEKEYKFLCLLYWSFTGKQYYFRQAGYKLDYDDTGKAKQVFYELVQMCAYQLKELFEWISVKDNVDKAIRKIEKMKKHNGYKYATYEKDEITEDITIKQLIYNIYKVFPRNSTNLEYRRALALALKSYKNKQTLTPLEISMLRDIYDKHALDMNRGAKRPCDVDESLQSDCELLLRERYSGKINSNHFAYVIIETLKKNNYTRCSVKQESIIKDALKLVKNDIEAENEQTNNTEIISDSDIDASLQSLSNAIGQGLFEEEDE